MSEIVSFGSKVRLMILGKGLVARRLLFILRLSDLEKSAALGVKGWSEFCLCLV